MEFLIDYNILEEEIEKIKEVNSKGIIKNIILNKDNVIEILDYLNDLGVGTNSLRDLFIYQIGIFFKTKKELMDAFEEYEIDSIVKSLNYDVNTFDLIEF